ncbi:DUF11 domain-containing protein [Candidatus Daviesbacteria bacterium]|nr:DUF11 domain-containing protein [Candidatus Daviesbacteria bacterium]
MIKRLAAFSLLAAALVLPNTIFAAGAYGQPELPSKKIFLDKQVFNPTQTKGGTGGGFVDNLTLDQNAFLPGQEVVFKVTVKNILNEDLRSLTVTDRLPQEVSFVSTTAGTYNSNTHTVTFVIDNLKVNETRSFELKVKIKEANQIPSNVFCMSNLAQVTGENMSEQDTSSFCVQKQVLGVVQELPKTGVASTAVLISSVFSLGLSAYLYRKSKVN